MTRLLFPPILLTLIAFIVGGSIGRLLAPSNGLVLGALAGGLCVAISIIVMDAQRVARLAQWLRQAPGELQSIPSAQGGEIAIRVGQVIHHWRGEAERERSRLADFVSAMEASPSGVLLLTGLDQIEWCNALAAYHFGLEPGRDRLQRVTNLVRSPAFVSYLQTGKFAEPVTFPNPRGQGSLQVIIRPYGTDSKLVLSQDLTERERSDAMRRDFVANVSHEIRTPLTVLSGFLETLRDLPLTDVEKKRVISLMAQQADRMGNLVGDLLTLAQLEGSPRPGGDRWVRVAHLFGQVEAEARALSAGRHEMVFSQVGDAQIAGMESELQSAIANLVTNAVRYTPDGGRIDVSWTLLENGSGEIRVADTGRGVAREHLARLTERFYRVDGSRSRESGGTGLGLSIVKHVTQRHGGELDIVSEVDKGSTFRLVLPASRVRIAALEPVLADAA